MKLIAAKIVVLYFLGSTLAQAGDGISATKCFKDFCVGSAVFYLHGHTKKSTVGEIVSLDLRKTPGGGIATYANVKTKEGTIDSWDLRNAGKFVEGEKKCATIKGKEFCTGQLVGTIPKESDGDHSMVLAKIFRILEVEGIISDPARKKTMFITELADSSENMVLAESVGLIGKDTCVKLSGRKICLNSRFQNGMGSEDRLLGYFPLKDEFLIAAGDLPKQNHRLVTSLELKGRLSGRFDRIRTFESWSNESASISKHMPGIRIAGSVKPHEGGKTRPM